MQAHQHRCHQKKLTAILLGYQLIFELTRTFFGRTYAYPYQLLNNYATENIILYDIIPLFAYSVCVTLYKLCQIILKIQDFFKIIRLDQLQIEIIIT